MSSSQTTSDPALPDWAVAFADGAVRTGIAAPRIEESLVGKGLNAKSAARVVDQAFEKQFRANQSSGKRERLHTISVISSGFVAAGYLVALGFFSTPRAVFYGVLIIVLPLACIWFPNAFGYVGPAYSGGYGFVNRPTPAIFIAIGGWIVLLSIVCGPLIFQLLSQ